jgi:LPS-assembly lipoprotein
LYGENKSGQTDTTSELARVEVGPIKDRVGQLVRNHLLDQLTPKGVKLAPHYRLTVELGISQEGVALARDEAATRFNLQLRGRYSLIELQGNREILQGTARSIAVYNVVSADYSTLTAEADAKRRAAQEISDEIKTRLAVFFSRRSAAN